jgi:preprotein translocase subunit Sss1
MKLNIKERLAQYRRTIEVSRKPDKEEFFSAAKITG